MKAWARIIVAGCLAIAVSACSIIGNDGSDRKPPSEAPGSGMTVELSLSAYSDADRTYDLTCRYQIVHYPGGLPDGVRALIHGEILLPDDLFKLASGDTAWTDSLAIGETGTQTVRIKWISDLSGFVEAVTWSVVNPSYTIGGSANLYVGKP